jgi:hypothetical protein
MYKPLLTPKTPLFIPFFYALPAEIPIDYLLRVISRSVGAEPTPTAGNPCLQKEGK